MSKFTVAEMTPAEAASFLRKLTELTADGSRDWGNLEKIFEDFISSAYKAGKIAATQSIGTETAA